MNLDKLLQFNIPELDYTATPRDAMLYALGTERNVVMQSNGRVIVAAG